MNEILILNMLIMFALGASVGLMTGFDRGMKCQKKIMDDIKERFGK